MAPRTKKSTKEEPVVVEEQNVEEASKNDAAPQSEKQSQLATVLVGLLIIASGLLIYNYFQRTSAPETTNQTEQEQTDNQANNTDNEDNQDEDSSEGEEDSEQQEGQYTVMPGDTLWGIAEKVYGDGFQWNKIAEANQIEKNAYGQPTVSVGQILNVPDSAAVAQKPDEEVKPGDQTGDKDKVAGIQEAKQTPETAIQTYTVQHGDTLWSIAENVYGNGHDWVKIFNDPHNDLGTLENGRPLLHAGNVLYLPQTE